MNSNTVEFVIRMRDMMSGSLNRLGSASQSTFGRMAQYADRMNQRNRVLSQSYDQIQQRIRQVEQTVRTSTIPNQIAAARRELASLQRMSNSHPGNMGGSVNSSGGIIGGVALGTMAGNIALQAGSAFIDVVKNGIGSAISGSMQKEKDLIGLSTFLGKEGADEAYKNIRNDAAITPYDTKSLLSVNRALVSTGLSAKDAREDTMNLANAISATGGGNDELMRMAVNMQQIRAAGKATGVDIKQFAYAGINIYEMLAKSTGKSVDQVKDMDISYNELAKALAVARNEGGLYAGALEAMGKSKAGRWESIKDQANNALTDFGDAMSPIILKFLELGQKAINFVGPSIQKLTPYIESASTWLSIALGFVDNLGTSTGGWMDYVFIIWNILGGVYSVLKTAVTTVYSIVEGVVSWLGKSMIIKDIFKLIGWILNNVIVPAIGYIGDGLTWVWEKVLKPILEGLESAYKWVKELVSGNEVTATVNHVTKAGLPASPTTPSYSADLTRFGKGGAIAAGDEQAKKNKTKSKSTGDTISGGGPKTINITVGKFFDSIQFTTMNGNESAEKLTDIVTEALGRILYNGAKMI